MNCKSKAKILLGIFTICGLINQMSGCCISYANNGKRNFEDRGSQTYYEPLAQIPRNISILNTNLITAVTHGDIVNASLLLTRGANPNAQDSSSGWTALHLAAIRNNLNMVCLLIQYGAIPYATINGRTPLSLAMSSSADDVVVYLLTNYPPLSMPTTTRIQSGGTRHRPPFSSSAA